MTKKYASTQSHLDILDIRDDMLVLRGGEYRLILQTSAVNFDLLSETEQDALVYAYGALVNALKFPIQIVVHTRPTNIANYLQYLDNYEKRQPEGSSLRRQIHSYRDFIAKLVMENNVLNKRFFIVLPYSIAPIKGSAMDPVLDLFLGKRKKEENQLKNYESAKVHLEQRRLELMEELSRMGIRAEQLNNQQITELFYELYNARVNEGQPFSAEKGSDYAATTIKAAVE